MAPWFKAIGIVNGDGLLKGALFLHDWNGFNVEVAYYGPASFTKAVLFDIGRYLFDSLKVTRVTVRALRDNRKMRQVLPRLGFHFEGCSPRYYGPKKSDDAMNYVMLRRDYFAKVKRKP